MGTNRHLHRCACPECRTSKLKKFFTRGDYVVIGIFSVLCFPVALWVWTKPRHHYCKSCGHSVHTKERGRLIKPFPYPVR